MSLLGKISRMSSDGPKWCRLHAGRLQYNLGRPIDPQFATECNHLKLSANYWVLIDESLPRVLDVDPTGSHGSMYRLLIGCYLTLQQRWSNEGLPVFLTTSPSTRAPPKWLGITAGTQFRMPIFMSKISLRQVDERIGSQHQHQLSTFDIVVSLFTPHNYENWYTSTEQQW